MTPWRAVGGDREIPGGIDGREREARNPRWREDKDTSVVVREERHLFWFWGT